MDTWTDGWSPNESPDPFPMPAASKSPVNICRVSTNECVTSRTSYSLVWSSGDSPIPEKRVLLNHVRVIGPFGN